METPKTSPTTTPSPTPVPAKAETPKVVKVIESIGTAKEDCFAYLDDAAEARKVKPESAAAMRLAVYRYIADTLKVSDDARKQGWQQFNATPTWFGTNASSGRQIRGTKSSLDSATEEYDV